MTLLDRLRAWTRSCRRDRDIARLERAIVRGERRIAEIQGDNPDDSDDAWLPLDRKQERRRAWLAILYRKRGRMGDLRKAALAESGEPLGFSFLC